jgi:hypothetical protein
MQTLMTGRGGSAIGALVSLAVLAGFCATAGAQSTPTVTSDEPAGYLVFPKIIVDTSAQFTDGLAVDTVIQLTNTDIDQSDPDPGPPSVADGSHYVNCWYINANSFCDNDLPTQTSSGTQCRDDGDCTSPGTCIPLWRVNDFQILLTPGQPIAWRASEGIDAPDFLPCDPSDPDPAVACTYDSAGAIPATENPFQGELKCVEVDADDVPIQANDLKGEATIYAVEDGADPEVDTATYNAIGIQARTDLSSSLPPANVLCLGGASGAQSAPGTALCPSNEYAGCPAVLILDHYFEGADSDVLGGEVNTELTLVPCTEDIEGGDPVVGSIDGQVTTTAQMLIYNEFEQRFSTSERVTCWENVTLADIDTRPGSSDDIYSIFAVGVQGTLVGQTRIRGVEGVEQDVGHGLLGVAQAFVDGGGTAYGSAAYNLNYFGERRQRDVVALDLPPPEAEELCDTCTTGGDCPSGSTCKACTSVTGDSCAGGAPMRCGVSGVFIECGTGGVY